MGVLKSVFHISETEFKTTYGTAFLIGPKILMTAAHNIYKSEYKYKEKA